MPSRAADPISARRFASLGCENKPTEAERETCYAGVIKEIGNEQEKQKAIKAVTNGVVYLLIVGTVVFITWLIYARVVKPRKLKVDVDEEVLVVPMAPTTSENIN